MARSKLNRKATQRKSMIKTMATSLVLDEYLVTTAQKAKHLVPYLEKVITHARANTLASNRRVYAGLDTKEAAHKLITSKLESSGNLRTESEGIRRGDNADMVRVSFVKELKPAKAKEVKDE